MLLLLCALAYSLNSALVKHLSDSGWPLTQVMASRLLVTASCLPVGLCVTNTRPCPEFRMSQRVVQVILSTTALLDLCCYAFACKMIPLGDATAIIGLYPAVTAVLARVCLKEPLDSSVTVATVIASFGGLLVARPTVLFGGGDVSSTHTLGYAIATCGCFLTSSQYLLMRHPSFSETNALQNVFSYVCIALPSVLLYHLLTRQPTRIPGWADGSAAVGMGALGMVAQGLMYTAAPRCPAAYATLLGSTEILWSYLWQLYLLRQSSDTVSMVGAALILGSFALPAAAHLQANRGGLKGGVRLRKDHPSDLQLSDMDSLLSDDDGPSDHESIETFGGHGGLGQGSAGARSFLLSGGSPRLSPSAGSPRLSPLRGSPRLSPRTGEVSWLTQTAIHYSNDQ